MTDDLLTQLADYGTYCDERQGAVSADDVTETVMPLPAPTQRTRPRNGWLIAMAAAALVLVLVGGLALLDPFGGESVAPSDEPAVTTTLSPATTLAVAPVPADESAATTTLAVAPVPVPGTVTVSWESVQREEGQGPSVRSIVGTSSGFLGTDLDGTLWRSRDGSTWEPELTGIRDVAIASSGAAVLASGLRDGVRVLFRSVDGVEWTEVDRSIVPTRYGRNVLVTTPSGLTWFGPNSGYGSSGEGVLALVEGDRITAVYDPPWALEACCGVTDLVEVGGNISAYQFDRNQPQFSRSWVYLGNGEWSDVRDMTYSYEHAVVGDTVLMFDQTNSTCCGSPISGTSSWALLSSKDGTNWTEIGQVVGKEVHTLRVNAGSSFWIYGPDIGGGGNDIEVLPDTTLGYSTDGINWQDISMPQEALGFSAVDPVTGFVHIAGETIFIFANNNPSQNWIGTIQTE